MNKQYSFDNILIDHEDQFVSIKGIKLKVNKGVFSPDPTITNSTLLLLNNLNDLRNKDILDVGCGSGTVSIYCIKKGANSVFASDVDTKAIKNTKENLKWLNINNVKVVKSSLYDNIEGKFDIIIGNLPINENLWDIDPKKLIRRFIKESKHYLKKEGKIYFTWFSISDVKPIREYCIKNKYKVKEKIEKKFGFKGYLFELSI
jgi:release factor glutamine methyltransferase